MIHKHMPKVLREVVFRLRDLVSQEDDQQADGDKGLN